MTTNTDSFTWGTRTVRYLPAMPLWFSQVLYGSTVLHTVWGLTQASATRRADAWAVRFYHSRNK